MSKKDKKKKGKRKKQKLSFAEELERQRLLDFYGKSMAVQLLGERPKDQLAYLYQLDRANACRLLSECVSSW
jgi:hypothetical protein